jgi:hypothetical protein
MMLPARCAPVGLRRPLVLIVLAVAVWPASVTEAGIRVSPEAVALQGNFARAQLVVSETAGEGSVNERSADLTHTAVYASDNPAVVGVSSSGQLLAVGDGAANVAVTAGGESRTVAVTVAGVVPEPQVGFIEQVMPVLSKAGCNAGACHASQYGKGGFKLSVFGFAPGEDWQNIVRDWSGRRIDRLDPDRSLLLLKPTLALPHGGNRRLVKDSVDYQVLRAWIAGGLPGPNAQAPTVAALRVLPERRVGQVGLTQQLQVVATWSDGTERDVTHWTKFDSGDDSVLSVTPTGQLTTVGRGQAVVLCRFEGQAQVCTVVVPYAENIDLPGWVDNNFVDTHAAAKFRELGIAPSPLCDDATFLRRAYLDAIGTLPTLEETRGFLASTDPDKRRKLVDYLLGFGDEPLRDLHTGDYAAYWSLKWSDLVRNSSDTLGAQGMWAMHNWIKESFRANKPFDHFVRELVTAKGSIYSQGPANYFRIASSPDDLAETTAQVFLGVRLQCAKCHHHPFEKYGQGDYYGFAAFFARVGTKGSTEFGMFGAETIVLVRNGGEVGHPRTGQILKPTPLEGAPLAEEPADRRVALADWLAARDNPFLARNVVNRYVGYLLGRGLCMPIDDMRATNPPSNIPLMDALAEDFAASGYNLKHLLRTIMQSRLYQLDYQPTADNAGDEKFYSHYAVKRLSAEALLDAIDRVTEVQTKFPQLPLGTKAIELPDANYDTYTLKVLGKPKRVSTCECERVSDPSLVQTLHLLNSDVVSGKIANPQGRVARLLSAGTPHDAIVEELYLATLCRPPTEAERLQLVVPAGGDPKTFYEDLLWALVNSKHFVFNH